MAKNKETYFIKRLIKEVGNSVSFFNPWLDKGPPLYDLLLVRTSGVYGNDLDLAVLKNLASSSIINPLKGLEVFRDKPTQFKFFSQHELPHIPWWNLTQEIPSIGQGTYLVKPVRGQGGWGVQILRDYEFKSWLKQQREKNDLSYVLQPFIGNATEYRVFFIGPKFRLNLKRLPSKNSAANFTQGGEAVLASLDENASSDVEKLIALSGAHYGAVDLLVLGSDVFILELNVVPGIEQLEKISGHNIIKELLTSLVS